MPDSRRGGVGAGPGGRLSASRARPQNPHHPAVPGRAGQGGQAREEASEPPADLSPVHTHLPYPSRRPRPTAVGRAPDGGCSRPRAPARSPSRRGRQGPPKRGRAPRCSLGDRAPGVGRARPGLRASWRLRGGCRPGPVAPDCRGGASTPPPPPPPNVRRPRPETEGEREEDAASSPRVRAAPTVLTSSGRPRLAAAACPGLRPTGLRSSASAAAASERLWPLSLCLFLFCSTQ